MAYFPNTTSVDAIINGNIGLLSDSALRDAVLKSILLQAHSNNRGTNKHNHRNTYLFRLFKSINSKLANQQINSIFKQIKYPDIFCADFPSVLI